MLYNRYLRNAAPEAATLRISRELDRLLALRCLEELDHKPRIHRSFAEEAGIDYIVEEVE